MDSSENKDVARFSASDRKSAVPSSNLSVHKSSAEASVRQTVRSSATESVINSSTYTIDCSPCSTADIHVEAVGYCSDCKEYLCQTCYIVHSRSIATQDHSLMNRSTMPVTSTSDVTTSIGTMSINQSSDDSQFNEEFNFKRDINIKYPDEEKGCFIVRMTAISDHELVIIDYDNMTVKMIDLDNDVMTGFIKYDTEPCDITSIPNREVAVTLFDAQQIKILSTTEGLSQKRTLKLSGICLAVEYCNGKLYVSYHNPVKFQILSLSGGVKKTIKPDSQFLEHCTVPRYIAVHPDESKIYVSDWKNNMVLCMDMNGVMLAVYKDEGLEKPHDITFTPFSAIYLCNREQHIVYKMSEDLSEAVVILNEGDGLNFPHAICFCSSKRSLYISNASLDPKYRNVIKQYIY